MASQLFVIQHVDIRRTIEQRFVRLRTELNPQLAIRPRHTWLANRVPASVKLIVAIYRQTIVEAGEHGLTMRIDCGHGMTGQRLLELFKPGQAEAYGFNPVVDQNSRDSVCRQADFGSFRHG